MVSSTGASSESANAIRVEARNGFGAFARSRGWRGAPSGGKAGSGPPTAAVESLWIRPKQDQTPLVHQLRLELRDDKAIKRDDMGQSSIPGISAAGDCASGPMQQAILAAADGARTIFPIVRELVKEDRRAN